MLPDDFESFAVSDNDHQVADALADADLRIEQADWNTIDSEDLVQLLDAKRTVSGLARKYRERAEAEAGDGGGRGD